MAFPALFPAISGSPFSTSTWARASARLAQILLRKSLSSLGAESARIRPRRDRWRQLSDGISWDVPNPICLRLSSSAIREPILGKLGRTVTETGAHKFGSSQDDDKSSKPIASAHLRYSVAHRFAQYEAKQLCVFKAARTGVKPTSRILISTVKAMEIDQFYQRYRIVVQRKTGPTGGIPYFSFD